MEPTKNLDEVHGPFCSYCDSAECLRLLDQPNTANMVAAICDCLSRQVAAVQRNVRDLQEKVERYFEDAPTDPAALQLLLDYAGMHEASLGSRPVGVVSGKAIADLAAGPVVPCTVHAYCAEPETE